MTTKRCLFLNMILVNVFFFLTYGNIHIRDYLKYLMIRDRMKCEFLSYGLKTKYFSIFKNLQYASQLLNQVTQSVTK